MKVVKSSIVFKSSCLCCFPSINLNLSCKERFGCFQISSGDKMDQINDVRNPTKPIIGAELLPVSQRPSSNSYGDWLHVINRFTAVNARSPNTGETYNSIRYGRCVLSKRLQLSMQGHWIQEKHQTPTIVAVMY